MPLEICSATLDVTILVDTIEKDGVHFPHNVTICIGSDGSV